MSSLNKISEEKAEKIKEIIQKELEECMKTNAALDIVEMKLGEVISQQMSGETWNCLAQYDPDYLKWYEKA